MNRRLAIKNTALLMGSGLAATVFSSGLQSCNTKTETSATSDWTPVFFTADEALMVEKFADHLLPATETLGAIDVLAHRFLDKLIGEIFTDEQKTEIRDGLTSLDAFCAAEVGEAFNNCSPEQLDSFFNMQEDESMVEEANLWGSRIASGDKPSFYRQLKGLCLFGYFTSEKVGEEVLSYDPVPGKFQGCVPAEEVGNMWSL
ncbi:MAG: gluconate 2-dehydrogenase subunit 3 family protein [Cyclobacteriaceae bacterium]|nr:gluconate 2-dehydrogenase subunit 3 family protein [Cyclobacteriaceae bacterium]